MRAAIAFGFLALLASPAAAQMRPQAGVGDPRIQSVLYDPNQVVLLEVAPGYQLTVEFAPDERIENVAVGDSGAWQVAPNKRGDRLFIKPNQNGVTTDMTVVTDARSYIFELAPGAAGNTPFTVRFRYLPPLPATPDAGTKVPAEQRLYKLTGARELRPDAMSDDGDKTYLIWRPDQPLPAVFAIGRDGKEMLVDGAMRDGRYVIDSVSDRYIFRLDKKMAAASRLKAAKR